MSAFEQQFTLNDTAAEETAADPLRSALAFLIGTLALILVCCVPAIVIFVWRWAL